MPLPLTITVQQQASPAARPAALISRRSAPSDPCPTAPPQGFTAAALVVVLSSPAALPR